MQAAVLLAPQPAEHGAVQGFYTKEAAAAFVAGPGYGAVIQDAGDPAVIKGTVVKPKSPFQPTKHQQKAPRPQPGPAQPLGPPLLVGVDSIKPDDKYRLVRAQLG